MKTIIFGAGQNGGQCYHIIKLLPKFRLVGFLDDDASKHGTTFCNHPVLGGRNQVESCVADSVTHVVIAVGENKARASLAKELTDTGLQLANLFHPRALIDDSARIGKGVVVEMGASIHPESRVGDGLFLGGDGMVPHNGVVGDFVLIGGGVSMGGGVRIGDYTVVGVGSSIAPGIEIGRNAVIGVGAAVIRDVPDDEIVVGVPARALTKHGST